LTISGYVADYADGRKQQDHQQDPPTRFAACRATAIVTA